MIDIFGSMTLPARMVRELVERYGSINAASRKTDIPVTTLFRIQSEEHKGVRLDTLRKIAAGLDLSLAEAVMKYDGEGDSKDAA